jgi:hypothetical protein
MPLRVGPKSAEWLDVVGKGYPWIAVHVGDGLFESLQAGIRG